LKNLVTYTTKAIGTALLLVQTPLGSLNRWYSRLALLLGIAVAVVMGLLKLWLVPMANTRLLPPALQSVSRILKREVRAPTLLLLLLPPLPLLLLLSPPLAATALPAASTPLPAVAAAAAAVSAAATAAAAAIHPHAAQQLSTASRIGPISDQRGCVVTRWRCGRSRRSLRRDFWGCPRWQW
jgi:hypothetical protein